MSRSYKHTASYSIKTPGMKKLANKKIRHIQDIANGSFYKKMFQSYDICDYKVCTDYQAYLGDYLSRLKERVYIPNTLIHNINHFFKLYVRK